MIKRLLLFVLLVSLSSSFVIAQKDEDTDAEGWISFGYGNQLEREIVIMRPDGSDFTYLTDNDWTDSVPHWSADCSQILYMADETGDREVYVMDADGDNVERISDNEGFDFPDGWSPDGEQVLVESQREDGWGIFIVTLDDMEEEQVVFGGRNGDWSPDGQYIVYVAGSNLMILDLETMDSEVAVRSNNSSLSAPDWSASGDQIVYTERDAEDDYDVYIYDLESEDVTRFTDNTVRDVNPTWSPDEEFILYTIYNDAADFYSVYIQGLDEDEPTPLLDRRRRSTPAASPEWCVPPEDDD